MTFGSLKKRADRKGYLLELKSSVDRLGKRTYRVWIRGSVYGPYAEVSKKSRKKCGEFYKPIGCGTTEEEAIQDAIKPLDGHRTYKIEKV